MSCLTYNPNSPILQTIIQPLESSQSDPTQKGYNLTKAEHLHFFGITLADIAFYHHTQPYRSMCYGLELRHCLCNCMRFTTLQNG